MPFIPPLIAPTPERVLTPTIAPPPTLTIITGTPTPTLAVPTVTPTPIAGNRIVVDRVVWDCFIEHDCSGFEDDRVLKWEGNNINVYSEGQYQTELREVLDYLSPILNMNFNYASNEDSADLIALVGVDKSNRLARELFDDASYCLNVAGCGGASYYIPGYEIYKGRVVVWTDSDDSVEETKHVIMHEALHALTGVDHSRRLDFAIDGCHDYSASSCVNSALRLPYMLPLEKAVFELWAHPLIDAGDTYKEIAPKLVFDFAEMPYNLEPLVEAYKRLVDLRQFEYAVIHPERGCEDYNKQVEVTVAGLDNQGSLDFITSKENNTNSYSTNFHVAWLLAEVIRSGAEVTKSNNGYYASMTTRYLYDNDDGRETYTISFLIDEQYKIRAVTDDADFGSSNTCNRAKQAHSFIYR